MYTTIAKHLLLIVAMVATIGCDRVTKYLATQAIAGAPERSFLGDTIRIAYVENAGGFLGLGADLSPAVRTGVFTIGTGLMLCALVAVAIRSRWTGISLFGLALLVAGGASNWIDRLIRGSVVDFMNVGFGPLRTGVFNVADIAIMLGVGLIVFGELRPEPHSARPSGGRS